MTVRYAWIKRMPSIEDIEISKLIPNPLNVKKHPKEQINDLALQIQQEPGFTNPLVIDEDYMIWVGHGRLEAVKSLGWDKIPCIMVHNMSEGEKYRYMIKDNQVNESPWDKEKLQIAYDKVDPILFEPFEMDIQDIGVKLPITEETEDIPEPPAEPKSKLGDVYQLGKHRIMCGDSTKDLDKLLDKEIDLLLTDPPYGMNVVNVKGTTDGSHPVGFMGGKGLVHPKAYKPIIGDDKPFEPEFLLSLGKIQIIFGANHFSNKLPTNPHWIVWDKLPEKGQEKTTFSDCELAWTNGHKKTTKMYRHLWAGLVRQGDRRTELAERVHPTQKPVGLLSDIINDYSTENQTVLDCYLGSGSTLIACEKTNRICYGMELDPGYVDVIIERWENFTGKKAVKVIPENTIEAQ